jgi:hypothetical protein
MAAQTTLRVCCVLFESYESFHLALRSVETCIFALGAPCGASLLLVVEIGERCIFFHIQSRVSRPFAVQVTQHSFARGGVGGGLGSNVDNGFQPSRWRYYLRRYDGYKASCFNLLGTV